MKTEKGDIHSESPDSKPVQRPEHHSGGFRRYNLMIIPKGIICFGWQNILNLSNKENRQRKCLWNVTWKIKIRALWWGRSQWHLRNKTTCGLKTDYNLIYAVERLRRSLDKPKRRKAHQRSPKIRKQVVRQGESQGVEFQRDDELYPNK